MLVWQGQPGTNPVGLLTSPAVTIVQLLWAKLAVTDPDLAQVGRFFSHWLSDDLSQIGEQVEALCM